MGKWAKSSAIEALNHQNVSALIIHSKDDQTVFYKQNTEALQKKVKNPLVNFYIVDGYGHHPQYTKEASDYFNSVFLKFDEGIKDKSLQTIESKYAYFKDKDFNAMTIQNKETWSVIEQYLKHD